MRIGRSRVARGFDPSTDADVPAGPGAAGGLIGGGATDDASLAPGGRISAERAGQGEAIDMTSRYGTWADKSQSDSGPLRCHFLRSVGPDGRLAEAQKTAVPTHRCAAYGDPLPLSLRQQELVCLQRVHVSCPRYVRGTVLANENEAQPDPQEHRSGGVPLLAIIGVGLVALSIIVIVGGLLGIGPLGGGSGHPAVAKATPTAIATANPTPTSQLTASPTATATVSASPTVAASATPKPTATPLATSSWPPGATASRMDLLVPCTGQANCWVYTVRGPGPAPSGNGTKVGDVLVNIEKFFGVSDAQVRALNPTLGTSINPGEKLKIPPPTR
jgi:hypothetical protein